MQEQIREAIQKRGVFDAHEHLLGRRQRAQRHPDLFDWIAEAYLWADLLAAGMDVGILGDKSVAPEKKWAALERFLPLVNQTGYMEVCRYAWRDLCGMNGPDLQASNWKLVDASIRTNNLKETLTEDVLVDRCGIKHVLVDRQVGGTSVHFLSQKAQRDWYDYLLKVRPSLSDDFIASLTKERETDSPYLRKVVKIDSLSYGWLRQAAAENRQLMGVDTSSARTLADYAQLVDTAIGKAAATGAVGLKTAQSGWRTLEFGPPDPHLAEAALQQSPDLLKRENVAAFENFVFREVIKSAGHHLLPLQIHLGSTYGPGGRTSHAYQLTNLIQEYPDTTFVLMHASWPYWGETEQLAKRFPNVRLDLAWAIMLAPAEAGRMLESMFTAVPANKLIWGGDAVYVEETYGALVQATRVVATALTNLVQAKLFTQPEAVDLAVRLFCSNGPEIYRLS